MFHNLCRDQHEISAPPLVCARSGYLHTICSDVTQRKGFHHYISDCRLSILGRVFTQTGLTALPSRRFSQISYPQFHDSASHAIRFHAESGSGYLLMMLQLIFHWTKLRSVLVNLLLPTSVICQMGFTDGLPDNTIRITMIIPTQIQNQPLVSHIFLTFQIRTRQSFAASATAGRVAATIRELQPIGGRRRCSFQNARSFASNRPSLFPGLPR